VRKLRLKDRLERKKKYKTVIERGKRYAADRREEEKEQ
jgi:hypothetical protein